MCGIVGGTGLTAERVQAGLDAIKYRGPDDEGVVVLEGVVLGHVRLSIQGLGQAGHQPFIRGDTTLVYNGEIWNKEALKSQLQHHCTTDCDTEVVAAVLDEWGPAGLDRLEGMFALAWVDQLGILRIARDRFGEVPLHLTQHRGGWLFASEIAGVVAAGGSAATTRMVDPGVVIELTKETAIETIWYSPDATPVPQTREDAAWALRRQLGESVQERTVADVPVCCLLSGGIDSALVTYLLTQHFGQSLVAYTAVYNTKSRDLKMARLVADTLGIELREVKVEAPTSDDLASVIRVIEMPYKAQVEIGWACLALAREISRDGFRVTFSGEGSDELWASYGFAYHALKTMDWHTYRKELFREQARKNFPRCNKIFMRHGVECRLPFLNRGVVEGALGMPQAVVQNGRTKPKAVLSEAFRNELPPEVVTRPKVAFQDGMGLKDACATAVADPKRFYTAVHRSLFR